jgi:arylsulfatase A-like enzyme
VKTGSLLLQIILFASLASGSPLAAVGQNPRKPNIVFILADDLGYGDLGCYGQRRIHTPNLDKMAAAGMRFTSCYAGNTVCAPSRCALMTGYHMGHARIRGNAKQPLLPEDVTVAEVLRQAGYKTALIGKWGLGDAGTSGSPIRKGFDYYFGYLDQVHAHNYYPTNLWRNDKEVLLEGNFNNQRKIYSHDLFTQEALDFVEQNKTKPFFLYLAFTIPHANNERKNEGMEVPSDESYSNEPWPQSEKNMASMVTRMDRDIGTLIEKLRELGLTDNTIVFFSSDNGPHKEGGHDPTFFRSSGPFRGIKRDLYEGGIRVPAIAVWPGKIASGQSSDYPWAFWDFLPTAAELAGAKPPPGLDGISILPALLGKRSPKHPPFYWEFHELGFQQAARENNWKALRPQVGAPLELYDLARDPGENRNVAAEHHGEIKHFEKLLHALRTESKAWPIRPPKPETPK